MHLTASIPKYSPNAWLVRGHNFPERALLNNFHALLCWSLVSVPLFLMHMHFYFFFFKMKLFHDLTIVLQSNVGLMHSFN